MDKIKPFDKTINNENISFVYDPSLDPKKPYWTESSFYIYGALTQLISIRSKMESITYSVYNNLIIEMKRISFSDGENLATRLLITL